MSCEIQQERISARLSGELDRAGRAELEAHLATCAECAAHAALVEELWQGIAEPGAELDGEPAIPSQRMRARLAATLAEASAESAVAAAGQPLPFAGRKIDRPVAAPSRLLSLAAMLLVGLGLGYFAFGRGNSGAADVASLQSLQREVGDLHEMVALSLLERGSVSERLQGVSYGRDLSTGAHAGRELPDAGDQKIVTALFARLIEDPSVNVRLAALEALRPVAAQESRRGQWVAAVSRQDSPLVALSLIDLLLESGTAAARHDLEQLLANEKLDPVVRGYLRDRLGRSA
jgi:hypothetical protein